METKRCSMNVRILFWDDLRKCWGKINALNVTPKKKIVKFAAIVLHTKVSSIENHSMSMFFFAKFFAQRKKEKIVKINFIWNLIFVRKNSHIYVRKKSDRNKHSREIFIKRLCFAAYNLFSMEFSFSLPSHLLSFHHIFFI